MPLANSRVTTNPEDAGMDLIASFLFKGKLISKSNYKGKTNYLPKKYRDFEDAIAFEALKVVRPLKLETGWIVIGPNFGTRTHCDLNNLPKSICDALVKARIFKHDKSAGITVAPATYNKGWSSIIEIWA